MFGVYFRELPHQQCRTLHARDNDQWSYSGGLMNPNFGKVCSTANLDSAGQSAVYAPGGPRSAQFTLKVLF
jgi:hypothetical protein